MAKVPGCLGAAVRSWGARGRGRRTPGSREGAPSEACPAGCRPGSETPLCPPGSWNPLGQGGSVLSGCRGRGVCDVCHQPARVPRTSPLCLAPVTVPPHHRPPPQPPLCHQQLPPLPEPPAVIGVISDKEKPSLLVGACPRAVRHRSPAVGVFPQEAASLFAGWGDQVRRGTQRVAGCYFNNWCP